MPIKAIKFCQAAPSPSTGLEVPMPGEILDLCTERVCEVVIVLSKQCLSFRFSSRDSETPAGLLF